MSFSSDQVIEKMMNDKLGTGFTISSVTEVIEEDEKVISAALNELEENKADYSALTSVNNVLTAHTSNVSIHHTHTNKTYLDTVSGNVGTMAYENASSYSSATEIDTALSELSQSSLSGVTVNGVAVTPTNNVAPITISASTTNNAIVVQTDSNTGAVTLTINYIDCGEY